ncbi:hypothetical protein I7103_002767 [Vibrio parahaemolyticus]|nr:hypothetical protein [Vibrio parahaemolyticus]EGQ8193366.1 hypothetical protein [Vibrio parahaemolyticus]
MLWLFNKSDSEFTISSELTLNSPDPVYAVCIYPSNLEMLGSARMTWFEGEATI